MSVSNWRRGGRLLRAHRVPIIAPDSGVVTSLALDPDWTVVGLANSRIHIFSTRTGVLARTLIGHDSGVWAVHLVGAGGYWGEPRPQSEQTEEGGTINMVPSPLLSLSDTARTGWRDGNSRNGVGKRSDPCCSSEGWGQPRAVVVSGGCDKTIKVWDVKTGYAFTFFLYVFLMGQG
jgi:F-box and WD-40 domain protein CDC4